MTIIMHKIRLRDVTQINAFKEWVLTKDYIACEQLPSVQQFDVCEVSDQADADYHFIEIIRLADLSAFNDDRQTELFHSLESAFDKMAEVVDEITSTLVGDGYRA